MSPAPPEIPRDGAALDGAGAPGADPASIPRDADGERSHRFLSLSSEILIVAGPSGRILDVNPACETALGWSRQELTGRPIAELIHPEDRAAFLAGTATDRAEVRTIEIRLLSRDGSHRWIEWRVHPAGPGESLYAIGRDVTYLRRTAFELAGRAHRLEALARLGVSAVRETRLEPLFEAALRTAMDGLGVDLAGILEMQPDGRHLKVVAGIGLPPGVAGNLVIPAERNSQAGYALVAAETIIVSDISRETRFRQSQILNDLGVQSGLSVLIEGPNGPFGVLGAHSKRPCPFDRNQGLFLQTVANVLAAAIARRATEKSLFESEEQFRQAQKLEAVGRLAGGVAHDFNNILTVILGHSQILLMQLSEDNPLRRSIRDISEAGERAARLTRQLLAFSRKQLVVPERFDLSEVIADTEKLLRSLLGEDIELVVMATPGIPRVLIDPGQIEQVVMNLAVNARDAMPGGGRLVFETSVVDLDPREARSLVLSRPGTHVLLTVSDTGCGMDPVTMSRIFEPFFTTKEPGKGTGLGLSTVYGIVKQSGGSIQVDSRPGAGTTFRIYLPEAAPARPPAVAGQPAEEHPAAAERILLVEDEAMVRGLARRILEDRGYVVTEASTPEEALRLAGPGGPEFDLLLTDIIMPGMNGAELAEAMAGRSPRTKILFMSGYADEVLRRSGVGSRPERIVEKPFTPAALLEAVWSSLNAASGS